MSIKSAMLGFVGKYGPHSRLIASSVLNVVAPGSGALIAITETAIDAVKDIADDIDHEEWEQRLLAKVDQGQQEVERLSTLVEMLSGPLASICDQAAESTGKPDQLEEIISGAIANDPSLSQTLQEIQSLKLQFDAFQNDLRKMARHQEEVMPVYDRMNRIADYFDELWQAGIKPRDFVDHVATHRSVASQIQAGNATQVEQAIHELQEATPAAATVCVLEAAAATREFDYLSAQQALGKAVKLRPNDQELASVAEQVTVMATRTTSAAATKPEAQTSQKPKRLKPGDELDGWKLEARRGAGGWGQVFRATKAGETKAIKVMHPELAADRAFLERFKKEIASLWGLPKHPNLLQIDKPETSFGFCMDHQTWYLVTEYIDGPTLESYLATKGAISEKLVRQVFVDLIDGLARAHQANIVHRDIKPSNLIFRKSDQKLVLVDFGLAVGTEDFGETRVGGISIKFAAPEQHYGGSATKASDVFSMCAVMHYALNYQDPQKRVPHAFSAKDAPRSLRQALSNGMQMAPDQRPQCATELLKELRSTGVEGAGSSKHQSKPTDASRKVAADSATQLKTESKLPDAGGIERQKATGVTSNAKIANDKTGDLHNPQENKGTLDSESEPHKGIGQARPGKRKVVTLVTCVLLVTVVGMFAWSQLANSTMNERKRKLREIGFALNNFNDATGRFPASDSGYKYVRDGKPGLNTAYSWRGILFGHGYIGDPKKFEGKLNLEEHDSSNWIEANGAARRHPVPDCFRSPIDEPLHEADTSYIGIADERGFFLPIEQAEEMADSGTFESLSSHDIFQSRGRTIQEINGGLSNVIAVIEVFQSEVHWMAKADFTIEEAINYIKNRDGPVLVLMGDGSVQEIKWTGPLFETKLRAMMTIDDDEFATAEGDDFEIVVPDHLKDLSD